MALIPITSRDLFFDDSFFKSSWNDFQLMKEGMISEPRDLIKKFEDEFLKTRCMIESASKLVFKFFFFIYDCLSL